MKCCTLANIQMPDVVPWLLKAFILSRELPLLFQKVLDFFSPLFPFLAKELLRVNIQLLNVFIFTCFRMTELLPILYRKWLNINPIFLMQVSKLLASILLISTVDGSVSIPFSTDGLLSISHWAAYFHQASLGTYLPSQYLACLKDKACYPKVSVVGLLSFSGIFVWSHYYLNFCFCTH